MTIADFDNLVLHHLTTFLGEKDVVNLSSTCKTLKKRINSQKAIWQDLARRHFKLDKADKTVNRHWYLLARDPRLVASATVRKVEKVREVNIRGEIQEVCGVGSHVFVLSIGEKSYPALHCYSLTDQIWLQLGGWGKAKGLKGGTVDGKAVVSFSADDEVVTAGTQAFMNMDGKFVTWPLVQKLPPVTYTQDHKLVGQGLIYIDHQYGTVQVWRGLDGVITLTRAILTLDSEKEVD